MRPAIAIVTTLATVIHFTFGCCLHAAHFGGDRSCCPAKAAAAEVHDDDCHCEEDHAGAPQTARRADMSRGRDGGADSAAIEPGVECGCAGCTCAATATETAVDDGQIAAAAWIDDVLSPRPPLRCRTTGGSPAGAGCAAAAIQRPPLFERLLV